MAEISFDDSELREFVADMRNMPAKAAKEVKAVVKRGGVNIKNAMREDMSKSRFFKGVTRGINFDETDGGFGVEVGPARGKPGSLANIAYFGSSKGGGGTVRDPKEALSEEAESFVRHLGEAVEKAMK